MCVQDAVEFGEGRRWIDAARALHPFHCRSGAQLCGFAPPGSSPGSVSKDEGCGSGGRVDGGTVLPEATSCDDDALGLGSGHGQVLALPATLKRNARPPSGRGFHVVNPSVARSGGFAHDRSVRWAGLGVVAVCGLGAGCSGESGSSGGETEAATSTGEVGTRGADVSSGNPTSSPGTTTGSSSPTTEAAWPPRMRKTARTGLAALMTLAASPSRLATERPRGAALQIGTRTRFGAAYSCFRCSAGSGDGAPPSVDVSARDHRALRPQRRPGGLVDHGRPGGPVERME